MKNIYIHSSTGSKYVVLNDSHKVKCNGVWMDAVLYQNSLGETFSRGRDDFDAHFTKVEEDRRGFRAALEELLHQANMLRGEPMESGYVIEVCEEALQHEINE